MAKNTVVLHINPDLEALTMLWLVLQFSELRQYLGLGDAVQVKLVPSGPLRQADWPGVPKNRLFAECLDECVFFDCGGGDYDQHEGMFGDNNLSSLDLLVLRSGFDKSHPELTAILGLISGNDLHGSDIAAKHDYQSSSTPDTGRHIRNMIAGWNIMWVDEPQKVVDATMFTLDAIYRCGKVTTLEEAAQAVILENIVENARKAGKNDLAERVREVGEAGLGALQAEWPKAVKEYWNLNLCHGYPVRTAEGQRLTLVTGKSTNRRFGQVTRLGNVGKKRRWPDLEMRPKADLTLQWFGRGYFVLSSRKRLLGDIAEALRIADHRKRYGRGPNHEQRMEMSRLGEYFRPDGEIGIYAAKYGKAVGNSFNTNDEAEPTVLTFSEVRDVILRVLER